MNGERQCDRQVSFPKTHWSDQASAWTWTSRPVPCSKNGGKCYPMDKFLSSVDKTRCTIYWIGIYPLDSLICSPNHLSQNFGELTTLPQSGFVFFYSKKNSRTFPGLRLIFPRLQISLYPFNSQDFKINSFYGLQTFLIT